MPDIDWNTLQQTKFIVISAPMGARKMFQAARLVDEITKAYEGVREKMVLSVTFQRMLLTQLASVFSILDYQEVHKAWWVCMEGGPGWLLTSVFWV